MGEFQSLSLGFGLNIQSYPEFKNLGLVWFVFFKTVSCSQKTGRIRKIEIHVWFSIVFCSEKHKEHIKH